LLARCPRARQGADYATEAYGKPWDFADNLAGIDQWGNKPEYVQNRKVENGILSMDVTEDPWFIWGDMWGQVDTAQRKVAIDLDRFPILEMKVRQSVPSAEWNVYGRVGKSDSLLLYKWQVTGTGWQRLRVDLRKQAHWKGVLSAFRIDPTRGVTAHVEMAWVRLIAATTLEHGHVETIGRPNGVPASITLTAPDPPLPTGAVSVLHCAVQDAAGKPVAGQPITVALKNGSGGELQQTGQRSLALGPQTRTGLTDEGGSLEVKYSPVTSRAIRRIHWSPAPRLPTSSPRPSRSRSSPARRTISSSRRRGRSRRTWPKCRYSSLRRLRTSMTIP